MFIKEWQSVDSAIENWWKLDIACRSIVSAWGGSSMFFSPMANGAILCTVLLHLVTKSHGFALPPDAFRKAGSLSGLQPQADQDSDFKCYPSLGPCVKFTKQKLKFNGSFSRLCMPMAKFSQLRYSWICMDLLMPALQPSFGTSAKKLLCSGLTEAFRTPLLHLQEPAGREWVKWKRSVDWCGVACAIYGKSESASSASSGRSSKSKRKIETKKNSKCKKHRPITNTKTKEQHESKQLRIKSSWGTKASWLGLMSVSWIFCFSWSRGVSNCMASSSGTHLRHEFQSELQRGLLI